MSNIIYETDKVNNNIQSAAIPNRRIPSSRGIQKGFSGIEGDFQQVRHALLTRAANRLSWGGMVMHLAGYFGESYEDKARQLFIEWLVECTPLGAEPPGDPGEAWEQSIASVKEDLGTGTHELYTLGTALGFLMRFDPIIQWPETNPRTLKPLPNSQTNIRHFLGALGISVWKNEFSLRYHVVGFPGFDELDTEAMRALRLKADGQGLNVREKFFEDVVLDIARQNARHPLREHLKDIEAKWDGQPRIETWLIDYLGAADTALNRAFGRLFLLAAIRRVRRPGTKFDFMLTLEGKQGVGKSSVGAILAGAQYFEDGLELGAGAKNTVEQTGGKWIVEMSELSGMGRREQESVKAMLSRTHDTARLAYERTSTTVPRQFVMIGTTNEKEYLRDPTGGRRFWTVPVGQVNLEKLKRDREQLLAEAAHLEARATAEEQAGRADPDALLRLPKVLWEIAAEEQAKRFIIDPIEEKLRAGLTDPSGELRTGTIDVDSLYEMIGIPESDRTNQSLRTRIGNIMKSLGYEGDRVQRDGRRISVYMRPDASGSVDEVLHVKAGVLYGKGLFGGVNRVNRMPARI